MIDESGRGKGGRTTDEVMRDPSRVAALRRVNVLDSPYDEVIDRLTRIAAKVLDAPVALFTLLDEERQICKSCVGLPEAWVAGRESPLAYSFCQRVVTSGVPLLVEDARVHPVVQSDPATLRGVIAYMGVPLITSDLHAIGTLCVIDFQPRKWTGEEVETLHELGAALISKIELRAAALESEERARLSLRAQEALQESETRFRTAFNAAPIGMALLATDGRWIRVNDALCAIVGYSREELLARSFQEITHPEDLDEDLEMLNRLLSGDLDTAVREKRYLGKDGREIWIELHVSLVRDARNEPFHFITQIQDITERRRESERLRSLSFKDELTDLYNRRGFMAVASEKLKLAERQDRPLVLLFADVDGMKWINDTFGHREGDQVLVRAAELFKQTFRESDLIGRLGGDEFAVLADPTSESEPEVLVERFQRILHSTNKSGSERPYELQVSLGGIVVRPGAAGQSVDELLALADARMYEDKSRKAFYPPVVDDRLQYDRARPA